MNWLVLSILVLILSTVVSPSRTNVKLLRAKTKPHIHSLSNFTGERINRRVGHGLAMLLDWCHEIWWNWDGNKVCYRQTSNIRQIPKLKCLLSILAVVFFQSIADVVGAALTGDALGDQQFYCLLMCALYKRFDIGIFAVTHQHMMGDNFIHGLSCGWFFLVFSILV